MKVRPMKSLFVGFSALIMGATLEAANPYVCSASTMDDALTKPQGAIRIATFNASLNRSREGELISDLNDGNNSQIAAVSEIIQRVRPDILLINEFDFDADGEAVQRFKDNYLSVGQNNQEAIRYPYMFVAPSNTGIPSGMDFDNDGSTSGPGDAYGFGFFPGQYGMLLLSRYPIDHFGIRTFRQFLWRDMPGALLPDDTATVSDADYYSDSELDVFRLSSKSHWDVPVWIDGRKLHVLAAHPTPPVFDGAEDRNGRRNHDEIRFWADYVGGRYQSRYIYDDNGQWGGLRGRGAFVILGDYNADPKDGDSTNNAIMQLLDHPAINSNTVPGSFGGLEDSLLEGLANIQHQGHAATDTADFNPNGPGNLRVDYVLPSKRKMELICGGVFWPSSKDTTHSLVGEGYPVVSSDHRLVWADVKLKGWRFFW
ncbi:endonuclease/exonuclease/phosphatase family protein [Pleionea sp. CnH1-48]|uniref:endonuclease/exonuclease/phosphatase family protein n=1 Tax=Pleionea sp. CnH1-48 TaxID=2954494 RepID=UPI002096A8A3|nr:endonuclease/exonuclease/phosphatase family protein [Pleionea sp. CnH1-48]MCO7223589.1 endonuclease/exonuclease/phosphatase family protein [Pleionea sp. CnH1-48]